MLRLEHGDSYQVLDKLIAEGVQVDSVITDPPYGLHFMGKKWDYDVPSVELWKTVFKVLKPGGIALVFAGSRTQHRMAVNVEDAGFELKDTIMWVYGSGFPKSHDISKAIDKKAGAERKVIGEKAVKGGWHHEHIQNDDGWKGTEQAITTPATDEAKLWDGYGTQLKPAYEPIIVAMKPLDGTYAHNALVHGVAGMNIDECRIKYSKDNPPIPQLAQGKLEVKSKKTMFDDQSLNKSKTKAVIGGSLSGRFPANLIHDGSEEVEALFPNTKSGATKRVINSYEGVSTTGFLRGESSPANQHGDSGSASRFFYCAKASKKDRGEGNNHPTVKPLELMKYLCRLTKTPTEGIVLDPFMGSGTTGVASLIEGRDFIGIEREKEYFDIASKRIKKEKYQEVPLLTF